MVCILLHMLLEDTVDRSVFDLSRPFNIIGI